MAKSAKGPKRTTDGVIKAAVDRASKRPRPPRVTDEDIGRRAFELYLARGGEHGHDEDDWLQAEQELRARSSKT
jgi:hypothetical protein